MEGLDNRLEIAALSGHDVEMTAVDPDPAIPDHQRQRLIPPKAAMPLSGSRTGPASDRT